MRIGIPKDYFGEGLDPEVKQAVLDAIESLKKKGAIVEEFDLSLVEYERKNLKGLNFSKFLLTHMSMMLKTAGIFTFLLYKNHKLQMELSKEINSCAVLGLNCSA